MFIETLFTIAKTWNQPKHPSTVAWIKKMWHIYMMEYYAVIKKMSSCLCRDMDESGNYRLSKLTQEQKNQTPNVLIHRQVLSNGNT